MRMTLKIRSASSGYIFENHFFEKVMHDDANIVFICKISKFYVWHDIFLQHDRLKQIYHRHSLNIRSVIINIWRFVETDELSQNPHG